MIANCCSGLFARMSAGALALTFFLAAAQQAGAQETAGASPAPAGTSNAAEGMSPPADYVIGPEDVLAVLYWREKDLSAEVTVRPDGKISLPLLNDVDAAGLTPTELRDRLTRASQKFVADPNVTVVVRQMNSRKVFITGEVSKPGTYPLAGPTTVLQLIALAGGLREYADAKNISILRYDNGKAISFRFNYRDVASRRNLSQNIELKAGDTIVVP